MSRSLMLASLLAIASSSSFAAVEQQLAITDQFAASPNADRQPMITIWSEPRKLVPFGEVATRQAFGPGNQSVYITTNSDPEGDMPRNVVFTPDGSAAVIVNRDTDTMTFFDIASQTITHTVGLQDFPVDVAVSPNGQYALSPNVLSNTVTVVDIPTHTVAAHVPITGDQPFKVAVTSDSNHAVVAIINDGVTSAFGVIDLNTLTETLNFPTTPQGVFGFFGTPESGIFGNLFTQFAIAPDDITIVLPDRGNAQVQLYDLTNGSEIASLATAGLPTAVDISSDGTTAVISHEGGGSSITTIDLLAVSVTNNFPTANLSAQIVRITPDKTHAIAAISNNVIFVNLTSGATTATLFTGSVGDIEISFDGQYAFVSNFNARVIDIATQNIVKTMPFAACVDAAASPVENRAVALNNRFREDIQLYNINGAAGAFEGFALSGEPPEGDSTRNLAISPDGTTVVVGHNTSRNIAILDLASGTVRSYVDTGDRILDLAVTPDGQYAVIPNTESNTVSILDLNTDTVVANLAVFTRPARVVISPDSQTAYVLSVAGSDRIHFINIDGAASSVVGSVITGQTGSSFGYSYSEISGIALNPDGTILAVCVSFDDQLLLIDTQAQSAIVAVPVGDFPIRAVFSPSGDKAYVANAFGDSISVVNIDGGSSSVEATIPNIELPLTMNVDATNSFVYVGSSDFNQPSMKVIDTSTHTIVQSIAMSGSSREAHLTPDGILYSASTAGELVVFSANGGASSITEVIPLSGSPSDMVFSVSRNTVVLAQPVPDGVDTITFCPQDLTGDATVDAADLAILLGAWGPNPGSPADLNGDDVVDAADLAQLLGAWGECG